MYREIFVTNILRLLKETDMSKQELAEKAGISLGFLSDLTNYKANPSLKIMEVIAKALHIPLPWLLESTDLDLESIEVLADGEFTQSLPDGYERITVVLPKYQAFIVKKWAKAAHRKRRNES